ncbi:MAG: site-specific integrase [Lachnospiraceae bacterium]|nr:site-specific integrase [Lachnospiraceae bacterium]
MGMDLRGKELGTGLRQKKDGKYVARFVSRTGKRPEKVFEKLSDAKTWLTEQRYLDEHSGLLIAKGTTVDEWFEYWIENIKKPAVRRSTYRNYKERYKCGAKSLIGQMLISDVKPLHCQMVLNEVTEDHSHGTTEQVRICMQQMFTSAVDNGLIASSPVTRTVKVKRHEKQERRVLTVDEQNSFVEYLKSTNHRYADQYNLCLETGIRAGELAGLEWQDIKDGKLTVGRTVQFFPDGEIYISEPKTKAGRRTIPLTKKAQEILKSYKGGKIVNIGYVFASHGKPVCYSNYNRALKKICRDLGIEPFTMHILRHTFATRCIEAGMNPKTLQYILGHSRIEMTMDLYVHVTDDTVAREMEKLEVAK